MPSRWAASCGRYGKPVGTSNHQWGQVTARTGATCATGRNRLINRLIRTRHPRPRAKRCQPPPRQPSGPIRAQVGHDCREKNGAGPYPLPSQHFMGPMATSHLLMATLGHPNRFIPGHFGPVTSPISNPVNNLPTPILPRDPPGPLTGPFTLLGPIQTAPIPCPLNRLSPIPAPSASCPSQVGRPLGGVGVGGDTPLPGLRVFVRHSLNSFIIIYIK